MQKKMVGVEGVLTQENTTIVTWILAMQKMNLLINIQQLKLKVTKKSFKLNQHQFKMGLQEIVDGIDSNGAI
jgi:hypothetical protein